MPRIDFTYKRVPADPKKYGCGFSLNTLTKKEFESFNASVLGLGDISKEGNYVQALSAFFDLEGFTSFCNQVDSHLVIPEFLTMYIDWLFQCLANLFKEGEDDNLVRIWGGLPFFAKFLGDGILFLWDTKYIGGQSGISNIIRHLHNITQQYPSDFLPKVRKHVTKPPARLRCGIARGQIISVGDENDYVGSCINIASRLQKLSSLSFAVSRRGVNLSKWKTLVLRQVSLKSIGDEELVYVPKKEIEALDEPTKSFFVEP